MILLTWQIHRKKTKKKIAQVNLGQPIKLMVLVMDSLLDSIKFILFYYII